MPSFGFDSSYEMREFFRELYGLPFRGDLIEWVKIYGR